MFDRLLKRIGEVLVDDSSRKKAVSRVFTHFRRAIAALILGYVAVLLLGAFLLQITGERNIGLAFALYLPRIVFLGPAVLLFPLSLLFHWRLFPVLIAGCLIFLQSGMGWKFSPGGSKIPSETGESLTVMTYNRGEHMNQSLQPFKVATLPDIIAFQDSPNRAAGYAGAEGYEEFIATVDIGEFTLLSRYPVLSSKLIEIPDGDRPMKPVGRFEIDFAGTPIAVYSVHFLSPRDTLGYYRRGAFLYGIPGIPGTQWAEKRKTNQLFWDARIVQAREFARILEEEPLPTVVVGDFNAPAGGYIHGIFLEIMNDAHLEAGHGFGYSFPGVTRNPLSLGGPWMRIDYLFSDEHWDTTWCITEPDRPSQHRAVAAQFRLREQP